MSDFGRTSTRWRPHARCAASFRNDAGGVVIEVEGESRLAAYLTRQLLALSRKQVLQPVVLDINAFALQVSQS